MGSLDVFNVLCFEVIQFVVDGEGEPIIELALQDRFLYGSVGAEVPCIALCLWVEPLLNFLGKQFLVVGRPGEAVVVASDQVLQRCYELMERPSEPRARQRCRVHVTDEHCCWQGLETFPTSAPFCVQQTSQTFYLVVIDCHS